MWNGFDKKIGKVAGCECGQYGIIWCVLKFEMVRLIAFKHNFEGDNMLYYRHTGCRQDYEHTMRHSELLKEVHWDGDKY